jgi:hypothetical protein
MSNHQPTKEVNLWGEPYYYITKFCKDLKSITIKRYSDSSVKTDKEQPDLIWVGSYDDYGGEPNDPWRKPYWHNTLVEAAEYLSEQRDKEVLRLEKKIKELKDIDFYALNHYL